MKMINITTQIERILEDYPEAKKIGSFKIEVQIFPKVTLIIDLKKYPKKPKITLPKNILRVIKDYEPLIPVLRNWEKENPPLISLIITALKNCIEMTAGVKVHFLDKTIKDICFMAKSSFPNEMFCLLRTINGVLAEYVIAPGSESSALSAIFFPTRLGQDNTLIASCHSHPTPNNHPSKADLHTFRKFPVNIIIGAPYNFSTLGVYNLQGNPIPFEIHTFNLFENDNF